MSTSDSLVQFARDEGRASALHTAEDWLCALESMAEAGSPIERLMAGQLAMGVGAAVCAITGVPRKNVPQAALDQPDLFKGTVINCTHGPGL